MHRVIGYVQIKNFRGIREGWLQGVSPMSILVGPNNSGKSTCLEAIAAAGEDDVSKIAGLLLRRGGPPHDALMHIVTNGATLSEISVEWQRPENRIQLDSRVVVSTQHNATYVTEALRQGLREPVARLTITRKQHHGPSAPHSSAYIDPHSSAYIDTTGKRSSTFIDVRPLDGFPVNFVDVETVRAAGALEDAYTRIELTGNVEPVIRALQRSMPGLNDLRILKSIKSEHFVLHTFCGNGKTRPVPAYAAGDGFKRFLALAAATMGANEGVILLEEPETYQHPRYLRELATLLLLAAKSGAQVILSTHSMELIDLLLHAPEAEGLEYPVIFRLRLLDGKLTAVRLDREQAIVARDELLEDLRA